MTALTEARNTQELGSPFAMNHEMGVAASENIFQGAILLVDAAGFIEEATTTVGLICAGVAQESKDNSSGGNGDETIRFRSGIFKFVNDAGTAVVQADVGQDCFVVDDNVVSGDNTGRSTCGKVYSIEPDGQIAVLISFPLSNGT